MCQWANGHGPVNCRADSHDRLYVMNEYDVVGPFDTVDAAERYAVTHGFEMQVWSERALLKETVEGAVAP